MTIAKECCQKTAEKILQKFEELEKKADYDGYSYLWDQVQDWIFVEFIPKIGDTKK